MAIYNLGTARGSIEIDTNDLKNADIALRGAGESMLNFGQLALGAFGYVIGVGADFEKEMSFVSAVTGASADELDRLRQAAIDLGKQGPFGPREVAAGFVDLAKAGLSADEIIGGVGEAAVNLAAAGDIPFTEAAETLVNVMRTFGIEAENVGTTIDSIAGAANASTIDISDMATSLKYAGAPAAALGLTVDELNAAIAILGNQGIRGSTAGTSLRRIFLQLASPTKAASDRMKELGLITEDGANAFFNANGEAKDLAEIFQILNDATKNLTQQEKIAALNDIFGARAVNSGLILMEQAADGFAAINEQIFGTSAADVAAERMDNLAGSITKFKAAVEAVLIGAGSPLQDFLKGIVDAAREVVLWFGALPRGWQTAIVASIGLVGALSVLAGVFLLTIGNIVRMVRVIGELYKALGLISRIIPTLTSALKVMGATALANPYVILALAIVAVGAALYALYKNFEPFKKFVDDAWQSIQRFWDGVLDFVRDVGGAISDFFQGFSNTIGAFLGAFNNDGITTGVGKWIGIVERLGNALGDAYRAVVNFVKGIGDRISSIGETIGRAFVSGYNAVREFISNLDQLPGLIAGAIGDAVTAIGRFLSDLPSKLGYALGFVIGRTARFGIEFVQLMVRTAVRASTAFVNFLLKLPGRIFNIFSNILSFLATWATNLLQWVVETTQAVIVQLFTWGVEVTKFFFNLFVDVLRIVAEQLIQLPERIVSFLVSAVQAMINFIPQFASSALNLGTAIFDGIVDTITNLPSIVWDILMNVIDVFTELITTAFNKAKDFAGALWDGFKDGLGINSPSYIEESLFAIQGAAGAAVRDLRSRVSQMQGLSQGIPINTGALGLAASTPAAPGMTVYQNAPLIGQATIRDERDALTLSRSLAEEQQRVARARGRNLVNA